MNIEAKDNTSVQFLIGASKVLKTLGHPHRLETVKYLEGGEKTVTEIQSHLGLEQATTSQHLRRMYHDGIVTYRRQGTTYHYRIANEFIIHLLNCFSNCERKIQSGEWDMKEIGFPAETE